VKLAFAVAAHLDPEILFLDEVLAVGDIAFQRKCFDFAKELQARDSTILFVSHNMFNIKTMCNRVIYLKQGQVEFDGSVEGGIERYERDCRLTTLGWDGGGHPEQWPVFIEHCEMVGADGTAKTMFDFGEKVKIKLDYSVREPMPAPNFLIALTRSDGVTACIYSTERDGIDLGTLTANGSLELELPPLKLIAEMYSVNITVRHKGFQDIVCRQVGTTFHVRDELLSHHFGVFNEPGQWQGDAIQAPVPAVDERRRLTAVKG
jgi:lipopolysaccharide transport system ATP-binding protein